jgi:hypothetical protein
MILGAAIRTFLLRSFRFTEDSLPILQATIIRVCAECSRIARTVMNSQGPTGPVRDQGDRYHSAFVDRWFY